MFVDPGDGTAGCLTPRMESVGGSAPASPSPAPSAALGSPGPCLMEAGHTLSVFLTTAADIWQTSLCFLLLLELLCSSWSWKGSHCQSSALSYADFVPRTSLCSDSPPCSLQLSGFSLEDTLCLHIRQRQANSSYRLRRSWKRDWEVTQSSFPMGRNCHS